MDGYIRVCSRPQQTRLFSSYTTAWKFLLDSVAPRQRTLLELARFQLWMDIIKDMERCCSLQRGSRPLHRQVSAMLSSNNLVICRDGPRFSLSGTRRLVRINPSRQISLSFHQIRPGHK